MSRRAKAVLTLAVLLILLAVGMMILTGIDQPALKKWKENAELEKKLKDPANAQHAAAIKADKNELKRLEVFRKEISGRIQSFGTNSPEGKFMQKEMQRLEQNEEMRKTHLEETKRELK